MPLGSGTALRRRRDEHVHRAAQQTHGTEGRRRKHFQPNQFQGIFQSFPL